MDAATAIAHLRAWRYASERSEDAEAVAAADMAMAALSAIAHEREAVRILDAARELEAVRVEMDRRFRTPAFRVEKAWQGLRDWLVERIAALRAEADAPELCRWCGVAHAGGPEHCRAEGQS